VIDTDAIRVGRSPSRCPYCKGELGDLGAIVACAPCGARHHADCREENGERCATCGASQWLEPAGSVQASPVEESEPEEDVEREDVTVEDVADEGGEEVAADLRAKLDTMLFFAIAMLVGAIILVVVLL
jgi:hypothetical protein